MNEIENEFLPVKIDGKPRPNVRQIHFLHQALDKLLVDIAGEHLADLDEYRNRLLLFVPTVGPELGPQMLAIFDDRAAEIRKAGLVVERDFLSGISDEHVKAAFPGFLDIGYCRRTLEQIALGITTGRYIREGQNYHLDQALAVAETYAHLHTAGNFEEPALPGNTRIWEVLEHHGMSDSNITPKMARKKNIKEAWSAFSSAAYKVRTNVRQADRLFASLFNLHFALADAEVEYEKAAAILTKPLEDYASWWPRYGNDADHIEYKHKGAEAAWQAKKRVKRNRQGIQDKKKFLAKGEVWVATALQDADGALVNYDVVVQTVLIQMEKAGDADAKKLANKKKKLEAQQELAAQPITVRAAYIEAEKAYLNPLELVRGLKGRNGYVSITDTVVPITPFRKWLSALVQNPATGRRVAKLEGVTGETRQWKNSWLLATKVEEHKLFGAQTGPAVKLVARNGMNIVAHFASFEDALRNLTPAKAEEVVIHTVEFEDIGTPVGLLRPEDLTEKLLI